MNEASNFCDYPCTNPEEAAKNYPPPPPPVRPVPRSLPGWPCDFQPDGTDCKRAAFEVPVQAQDSQQKQLGKKPSLPVQEDTGKRWGGLPDRDLQNPKYAIQNIHGPLSQKTINVTIRSHNGLTQYDTHNLYGTMMSAASRAAMIARRPSKRPLVVTRSTFAGAGSYVSHWLGDNNSDWPHYRWTIRGMLQFVSLFQVSMVGSDVCGFGGDVTEELCARWAMLGAFQPFYRNHNSDGQRDQEFYRWESVAAAARKAIDIRYRLLDYFYTAMMRQSRDATPAVSPVFFMYPSDKKTFGLELQYFYGPALLVAPVTEEGATSVDVYLPDDVFYDFYTLKRIDGRGKSIKVTGQSLTDIPLFLRGGTIVPFRVKSGMTTQEVRKEHFELIVALGRDGTAKGELYLDDGESLHPDKVSWMTFAYDGGQLSIDGVFEYEAESRIVKVTVLGAVKTELTVDMALTEKKTISL